MCQDYLPRCVSQIFCHANQTNLSGCVTNTLATFSGLVLCSIYWRTTLYSTLLGQYCTVFTDIYYLYGIYWSVLHSTHLFWAGIVRYLLKCTTLYSSLLGWYCTVFTEVYYTLLISSGLVLYSIYWRTPLYSFLLGLYSQCYNKTKLCVAHFAKQHPHSPPLPTVSLYQVAAEEAGRLRNFSRLTDSWLLNWQWTTARAQKGGK